MSVRSSSGDIDLPRIVAFLRVGRAGSLGDATLERFRTGWAAGADADLHTKLWETAAGELIACAVMSHSALKPLC